MAIAQVGAQQVTVCTSLRYGLMAIALYAAPALPYPERRRLSPQELDGHAAQGIIRLGGAERVRFLHDKLLDANKALRHGKITESLYQARVEEMLALTAPDIDPDIERFNRCVGYDYGRMRRAA